MEEDLNFDMVWEVVDCYMEAIVLAKEINIEVEAIALSRLGSVYDKILKDKIRAKTYFTRSIQLAILCILGPLTARVSVILILSAVFLLN